jgi:nicotinamidase-related amidase
MAGAFSKTDLDAHLRVSGIDTLLVAGIMTHLAVDSTARDAAILGYRVIVAADATATRTLPGAAGAPSVDATTLQRASLAAMADRFADVMTASEIAQLPMD